MLVKIFNIAAFYNLHLTFLTKQHRIALFFFIF